MEGKIRTRLALLVAVAALAAVIVPAGLALGTHSDGSTYAVPGGVVLLQMGKSGQNPDKIIYDDPNTGLVSQVISTAKNDCQAPNASLSSGPILEFTPLGTGTSMSEAKDQIGVRSPSDGSGENCVRVSPGEKFSVELGDHFGPNAAMGGFDLDIQLKFDSRVKATIYPVGGGSPTFEYFTGEGLPDNGPDSADDRRWLYVAPAGALFTKVEFEAIAGTFSLGGGQNIDEFGVFDPSSKGSQFAIGPVFDGEITCGDEVHIQDPDVPSIFGDVTLHAMDPDTSDAPPYEWTADTASELDPCLLKPYFAAVSATDDVPDDGVVDVSQLQFVPELANTLARYTMVVTVADQLVETNASGQVTSLEAVYDPDPLDGVDVEKPLEACEGQPPGVDLSKSWTDADLGLLPTNETACYYLAQVSPSGTNTSGQTIGTEVWRIFFLDDPVVLFR